MATRGGRLRRSDHVEFLACDGPPRIRLARRWCRAGGLASVPRTPVGVSVYSTQRSQRSCWPGAGGPVRIDRYARTRSRCGWQPDGGPLLMTGGEDSGPKVACRQPGRDDAGPAGATRWGHLQAHVEDEPEALLFTNSHGRPIRATCGPRPATMPGGPPAWRRSVSTIFGIWLAH
jgi:hypothetical protein